jgi:hypothetical protein
MIVKDETAGFGVVGGSVPRCQTRPVLESRVVRSCTSLDAVLVEVGRFLRPLPRVLASLRIGM